MSKNIKQGYYDSLKRFNKIDLNNFGGCLRQVINYKDNVFLEFRLRKSDGKLCIINVYAEGKGYAIFVQE